jgi:hypothetical protein
MVKDVRCILWLVYIFHHFQLYLLNSPWIGWSSGNGETKIQECAKKNNTWNRKFKIKTFFFLDHIILPVSFTELLPLQILYIFVSPLSAVGHITHSSWLLDHFTIQVIVYISHLSPFPNVFTEKDECVIWPTADSGETKM